MRGAEFGYTASGRLQYAVGPWGEYDYGYDGAGNMNERNVTVAGTKTYSFPSNDSGTSNQVTSVRDVNWNATRTLAFQAGGNIYQDACGSGVTYNYGFSARNRAVEIMKNNVEVGAYGYDAFEHRVWRQVFSPSTVQTHYIYDLDGRLLAEQNGGTGTVVKEYARRTCSAKAPSARVCGTFQLCRARRSTRGFRSGGVGLGEYL